MTAHAALPLLLFGQAQKEVFHNEALTIVDLLLNGQLATVETNEPPANPQQGEAHLVGSAPVGAWSGHEGAIAGYTPGGWRFIEPYEGLKMTVAGTGLTAVYGQTGWASAMPSFRVSWWTGSKWLEDDPRRSRILPTGPWSTWKHAQQSPLFWPRCDPMG